MKSTLGILVLSLMFSTVGHAAPSSPNYAELDRLCGTRGVLTLAVASASNLQMNGMTLDEHAIKPYGEVQEESKKVDTAVKSYCDRLRAFSDAAEANKK